MAAPDVDDELAVDVDRDGRADFLTVGDLLGERLGDLVESGVAVTLQDLMHRTIIAARTSLCSGNRQVTSRLPE